MDLYSLCWFWLNPTNITYWALQRRGLGPDPSFGVTALADLRLKIDLWLQSDWSSSNMLFHCWTACCNCPPWTLETSLRSWSRTEPIYVPQLQYNPISALSVTSWNTCQTFNTLDHVHYFTEAFILPSSGFILFKCPSSISQTHLKM